MDIWERTTFREIGVGDTLVTGDGYRKVEAIRPSAIPETFVEVKFTGQRAFMSYNLSGPVDRLAGQVPLHTPTFANSKVRVEMPRQVVRLEHLAQALNQMFDFEGVGEPPKEL
ncbi:hypothetical protein [Streptomyces sp. Tu6071]|uniref:hypothetical protein n=1 Tax=Streptomyces sp. Tu6071 TaxID=355249 RepID=UPI0005BC8580|nr:hypothetical protein [Streptomyces sp. Tu6071]